MMETANFQQHAKNFVVVHGKRVISSKVSGRFPWCSLKVVNTLNRFRFFYIYNDEQND